MTARIIGRTDPRASRSAPRTRFVLAAIAVGLCGAIAGFPTLGRAIPNGGANGSRWDLDLATTGDVVRASLPAEQVLYFDGESVHPQLIVGCRGGDTEIWIDFGRPVHPAGAPLRVSLRIDRGRPIRATWNIGSERRRAHMVETRLDSELRRERASASGPGSRSAIDLVRTLSRNQKLAVRSSTAYAGHLALSFELTGMRDALDRMADACGWSPSLRATLL